MNISKIYECEQKRLQKFQGFQLPNIFKKIGTVSLIVSILGLLIIVGMGESFKPFRPIVFKVVLVSMLLISLAKEKIEDEMITKLRMKSYSMAFVWGVIYALAQPIINFLVGSVVKEDGVSFGEINILELLWLMLFIQIAFFHTLKKSHK